MKRLLTLFVLCMIASAHGQTRGYGRDEIAAAVARLASGEFEAGLIEVVARAKAVEVIPSLEVQFDRASDVEQKDKIADALVRLGDSKGVYWDFLLSQATSAVDSDIPDSIYSPSQGRVVIDAISPEIQDWARIHHVSPETAGEYTRYEFPGRILDLAGTGDRRGIPILRRALLCRNYLIVAIAAKGLVLIQDAESVPLIVAAAKKAPHGYGSSIVESLIYFDSPAAREAVDMYVSPEMTKVDRDARAQGSGVFGW